MPWPVSATRKDDIAAAAASARCARANSSSTASRDVDSVSWPPAGIASRAFTARLMIACSICPGSPSTASSAARQLGLHRRRRRRAAAPAAARSPATVSLTSNTRGSSSCLRLKASSWRVTDAGALGGAPDFLDVGARGMIRRELAERQLRVAGDRGQRVVQIVRDAAGEPADRFHLLRLPQLILEQPAVGDVLHGADHPQRTALRVAHDVARARGPSARCRRARTMRCSMS